MPNLLYKQYQSLIRKIDLSDVADEIFVDLIKSKKISMEDYSNTVQLPNLIVYAALLKIASDMKPPKQLLFALTRNRLTLIFRCTKTTINGKLPKLKWNNALPIKPKIYANRFSSFLRMLFNWGK